MEEIFKGRLKNHNIEKFKQIDPYLNLFRQSLQVSAIWFISDKLELSKVFNGSETFDT